MSIDHAGKLRNGQSPRRRLPAAEGWHGENTFQGSPVDNGARKGLEQSNRQKAC